MAGYTNGNVSVDGSFARFGSKSYAIDKINSVDVRSQQRTGCLWMALAGISAIAVLSGLGSQASGEPSPGPFLVGALFGVLAFFAHRGRPKPIHHLMLSTSSGEVQAFSTEDEDSIRQLRDAIEGAMAGRS